MKKVLITGAATGLGFETAQFLAKNGFHVFAGMRDSKSRNSEAASQLNNFAESTAGMVDVVELDVTNERDIENVSQIFSDGLDCLINNAGLGALGFVESFSLEQVKKVFDVNLFGPFALSKSLLPKLSLKKGLVINVSSSGGRLCFPFLGVYNSSKFALEGLMESWNIESETLGVDICLIEPGAYPTDLHNKRLQADDVDVLEKYGELANLPEQMVAGMAAAFENMETLPQLAEISSAILALINATPRQRPVRTVVGDIATVGVRELNDKNQEMQQLLLKSLGM